MNQLANSLCGHKEDVAISSFGQRSRITVNYVGNLKESKKIKQLIRSSTSNVVNELLSQIKKRNSTHNNRCVKQLIHSGYFYSDSSSPLLLRGAPDSTNTVSEFHAEAPQATVSEGLAKGLYVLARVGHILAARAACALQ